MGKKEKEKGNLFFRGENIPLLSSGELRRGKKSVAGKKK